MDLIKLERKKRIQGVVIGLIIPIVLLLIVGIYGFTVSRPIMIDENNFAIAPHSYLGVLMVYITSISYYHAFFCLSGNMAAVWYLTGKKKNSMANGIIVPTAIYALILVALRLF